MQREFKISLSQEFYSDIVYLSQYDSDYPVIFTVTDKYSKAAGINGYTAKFTGTRGDGTGLGFTYTATAIGHTVSFTIDTMLTGVAGTHAGEIIFYDQNGLYFGTANVQIIVEPAARPDGTIDADEEELRDLAQQCQDIVDTAAAEVKGEAESWAVGERDGVPVSSDDPTYHNNAKYYSEQAAATVESISDVTDQVATNTSDISDLKEDLNENVTTIGDSIYSETELFSVQTSEGWKLDDNGYRVADADYQLMRFRVYGYKYVKVISDHKWQFQTSTTVTGSGTQYKVGRTRGTGTYYMEVPDTVTYVVISTPIQSAAHVYMLTVAEEEDYATLDARIDNVVLSSGKMVGCSAINYLEKTYIGASEPIVFEDGHPYQNPGSTGFKSAYVACSEGDVFTVSGDNNTSTIRVWLFADSTGHILTAAVPDTDIEDVVIIAPANAAWLCLNTRTFTDASYIGKLVQQRIEDVANEDVKNPYIKPLLNAYTSQVSDIPYTAEAIDLRIGIDTSVPTFVSGNGYAVCVPVIGGTSVRVTKPQSPVCAVCFTADYPRGRTAITHYTAMTGVGNTEFVAESQSGDNYLVIYTGATEVTSENCTFAFSQAARGTVELLPQLDEHMINLLKYRPVGKISKPYIAISCDDGLEPLATYTLPRIQYWNNYYNTDIPLHMALFDNSPVLLDAEYTALVKDMCDNHNCSIGIHGTQPYTVYSSSTALYAYIKKQRDTIIEKTGVTPTSVLYPHDAYTDQIMVMSGAFCGICASSSSTPKAYKYVDGSGRYYYVGEKTNLYEVPRFNISDTRIGSVAALKGVIDYAYEHNYVICPYFHDIDFTEHSEEANQFARTMFDALIQYGMEKGIEFINFGDIRYLT